MVDDFIYIGHGRVIFVPSVQLHHAVILDKEVL